MGIIGSLDELIANIEIKSPDEVPDLRVGQVLLVGSDYGGEHQGAHYQALGVLLVDWQRCEAWEAKRSEIRRKVLQDRRRMAYKDLGDLKRRKALLPFLSAANTMPGILTIMLIDKRTKTLFSSEGAPSGDESPSPGVLNWRPGTFEKGMRVVHLISALVAGFSGPLQDVVWFTDEDEIAPNDGRLADLTQAFSNVANHYLSHDLRHIRVGTSRSDTAKRDIEDFLSVVDLAAGAAAHVGDLYKEQGLSLGRLAIPTPKGMRSKAGLITEWLSDNSHPLKRLIVMVEPELGSERVVLKLLRFHRREPFLEL